MSNAAFPPEETPYYALTDFNPAIAHERPADVSGEWELVPEEDWNIHQRIAAKTNGWVSVANAISIGGGALTVKGLWDFARGRRMQGVAEVAAGRYLDLRDGKRAKRDGVRSEAGAFTDASVDKAALAVAAIALPASGAVKPAYAAATAVQQARIIKENVAIQRLGGNPTPNKPAKWAMAATWSALVGRGIELIAAERQAPTIARVAARAALTAEVASLGLSEIAIRDYRKQRQATKLIDQLTQS